MGRTRNRKTKRQPEPEWQAFQARLIHDDQIEHEIVRPTLALGQPIKDRAVEVGLSPATLSRKVQVFYQESIPTPSPSPRRAISRPDALQLDLFGRQEKAR